MLLGLDLGTTNVKALVCELDGRVVACGSAPVPLHHVGDDGVEQDIDEIYGATLAAIRQAGGSADLSGVRAVGVSAQGGALQLLDGHDRPLGRVVSWLDGRARAHNERIVREMGAESFADRTGHAQSSMALGQLLRIRDERPELLARPNRVAFVGDAIIGRLCGRRAHDATSLSCAVLYNPSLGGPDADILARTGIDESQLPDLLPARVPAGGLCDAVVSQTGLPAGIGVSPAVHDQYAAALGVGAVAPGDVMCGAGTAWVLLVVSDRLMRPAGRVAFVGPHPVDGLYGQILSLSDGGSAITWACRLAGLGDLTGERLDDLLDQAGAGAGGVRCRPVLVSSAEGGALTGLRLSHGPAHVLRAVVEGLTMELTACLRRLGEAGASVSRLILCGGAARSRVTPQTIADATGLPLTCPSQTDTSALGAAMAARAMLEPERSLAEISSGMAGPASHVQPGPNAALYAAMFDEYVRSGPSAARPGGQAE